MTGKTYSVYELVTRSMVYTGNSYCKFLILFYLGIKNRAPYTMWSGNAFWTGERLKI